MVQPELNASRNALVESPSDHESSDGKDKRIKTNRACDSCRRKKIRCEPLKDDTTCAHCKEYGFECTSILPSSETRKRKRTSDDSVPPKPSVEKKEFNYIPTYHGPTSGLYNMLQDSKKWAAEGTKTDDILKEMGPSLQINSTREGRGFAAFQRKLYSRPKPPPAPDLDPKLVDELIKIYWDRVHRYLPIVSKQQFYSTLHPPPPFLVIAMCAVAARQYPPSVPSAPSARDQEAVRAKLQSMFIYGDNLSHVSLAHCQALLLACMCYEYQGDYMAEASQAYAIRLTIAIRMAHDLGLHRGIAWDNNEDSVLVETKRRVWWACVILDRWGSACNGRPLIINDGDADVEMPSPLDIDNHSSKKNMHQYFCELTKITLILGRVIKTCYRLNGFRDVIGEELRSIEKDLNDYEKELPEDLKYHGRESIRAEGHLHIFHATVRVLFYRPILHRRPLPGKKNKAQAEQALRNAQSASEDVVPADYILPPNTRQSLRIQAITSINIITLELIQGQTALFFTTYYCILMATLVCVRGMKLEEGDLKRESTLALRGLREVIPKMMEGGFSFKKGVGELIRRFLAVSQLDGPSPPGHHERRSRSESHKGHGHSEPSKSGGSGGGDNLDILSSVALSQALQAPATQVPSNAMPDDPDGMAKTTSSQDASSYGALLANAGSTSIVDLGGEQSNVVNYFNAINNGTTTALSSSLNNAFGGFMGSNPGAAAEGISAEILGGDPTATINAAEMNGLTENYLVALAGTRQASGTTLGNKTANRLLNIQTTGGGYSNGSTADGLGSPSTYSPTTNGATSATGDGFLTEGGDLFGVEDALWLDPASLLMAGGEIQDPNAGFGGSDPSSDTGMYSISGIPTSGSSFGNLAAAAAAAAASGPDMPGMLPPMEATNGRYGNYETMGSWLVPPRAERH